MIHALVVILLCQLIGEIGTRSLGLPVPGPVLGLGLLLGLMLLSPKLHALVAPVGEGLLRHLSLLFVPAGVGVISHLDRFGSDGLALMAILILSTVAALLAGAGAFLLVARLTGNKETGND